jgi:hypothetical protein
MKKKLSSEVEWHLSMFYWYTEIVEFLANRLYGTDYQTVLNKHFRDQHLDLEHNFQIAFEEYSIVSDLKSELSKVITDEEILKAIVNHRNRLIQEKNRLIKELGTSKPSELKKFMQWHLIHHATKPSRFEAEPRIYRFTTRFYVSERDYQIVSKTGKGIEISVVPDKGKHPEGTYDIPHDVIMRFFESERQGNNWKKHKNFNQDGIPSLFSQYFHPFSD